MIAQGSVTLNTKVFDDLEAQIDRINTCDELQRVAAKEITSILAVHSGMSTQIAFLQDLQPLLHIPGADPAAIVQWLAKFTTLLIGPQLAALPVYLAQVAELTTRVTALVAKFEAKAASFESCAISVPAIPGL